MAITIIYGSYTIPFIVEKFRETDSYRQYRCEVDFLITGTTDAEFKTNLNTAEVALRKDSQRLQIKFGATTHRDFDPSTYSGLMARGTLSKTGNEIDTARSRRYTWTCEIALPASSSDDNFRREATWQISYSDSRRAEVSFNGIYTAGSSNTAKVNYDAQVATWISSVFTLLSFTEANFELATEAVNATNDENTEISFSRVYREILFNESAAGLNHAAIKNAVASFSRNYSIEGNASGIGSVYVEVSYSCSVDKTDGTYGTVGQLDNLWKDVIRPHLLTQAKSIWSGSFTVIENENTNINASEFTIQSSMRVLINVRNSILAYNETIELRGDQRWVYNKLLDGQDDTYTYWRPGRKMTATQTIEIKKLSGFPDAPILLTANAEGLIKMFGVLDKKGTWNLDTEDLRYSPSIIGQSPDSGGTTKTVYSVTYGRTYTYIAPTSLKVKAVTKRST